MQVIKTKADKAEMRRIIFNLVASFVLFVLVLTGYAYVVYSLWRWLNG